MTHSEQAEDVVALPALPVGYTARPVTLDDAEAIAALVNSVNRVLDSPKVNTADDMRRELQEPKFDVTTSTVLVADTTGAVVAYAMLWDNVETPVHPYLVWTVRDDLLAETTIAESLIAWGEQKAQRVIERCPPHAQISLRLGAKKNHAKRIRLIEAQGYTPIREWSRMLIDMRDADDAPAMPALPEGISVRPMRYPDELEAVVKAVRASFKDHWGHVESPLEEDLAFWQHWIETTPHFTEEVFWLAIDDATGDIAGICLCETEEAGIPEAAYVDTLGVLKAHRRRGLGKALLRYAFHQFYTRGRKQVALHVDATSLTGANQLYTQAGMHVAQTYVSFEKIMREGEDIATTQVDDA